jgi:two-component system, OmpR family, phosphate regulon response regulator PhoB
MRRGPLPTILVADDEPEIRELVAYRLSQAGYAVVQARDGEEAFRLVAGQVPDMAVLDVMMPRLNGFEFSRRFRRSPATQRLPVLLMADGYLTKPFSPDELLARVEDLLARRPA